MKKKKERKLRKAMKLPFNKGLPIVRKMLMKNYELCFRPDIAEWCKRHATEIQALVEEKRL